MRRGSFLLWLAVGAILALPATVHAQFAGEASLIGTVTDTTGGALPGVLVQAVHVDTGNTFETVTDGTGGYRLPVRIGGYEVTATLAGFGTVTDAIALLYGTESVVDFQMSVGGVEETVTVTGEAPLLDLTSSSVGGNVDARQMQELPVNGRNWIDLVMLAPGARANFIVDAFVSTGGSQGRGDFELNVDGQQVTQIATYTSSAGQPRFSRDAIAEFEFIAGRYDATQGRSNAVQVNAITKSGTNTPSGSFASYFRHDSMIGEDFVTGTVLPYSNQQYVGTFGGPLVQDRVHYFGSFEMEREPKTEAYTTGFAHFDRTLEDTRAEKMAGFRIDMQFTPQSRLVYRGTGWRYGDPLARSGGSSVTPSDAGGIDRQTDQHLVTLTQVRGNRLVNELKVGYSYHHWQLTNRVVNPNARGFAIGGEGGPLGKFGGPRIQLSGLTLGGGSSLQDIGQDVYTLRNDLTYSAGAHTFKTGVEYNNINIYSGLGTVEGILDARTGPVPASISDNYASLIPDLFDASTWNLDAFSSLAKDWAQDFGDFYVTIPRYQIAAYMQDDWAVNDRLTMNVGVRWDVEINAFANAAEVLPFLKGGRPHDWNNVGPRLGFTYALNDETVIRGGGGVYFGTTSSPYQTLYAQVRIRPDFPNDGRPNFASDPYDGPLPTRESIIAGQCTDATWEAGDCITREVSSGSGYYGFQARMPQSLQTSIGLQRQVGPQMAFEIDYAYNGIRDNLNAGGANSNLTYNADTGANYGFRGSVPGGQARRVWPWWGRVPVRWSDNTSDLHSMHASFTKRFSDGWQATGTYTLSSLWDSYPAPWSGFTRAPAEWDPVGARDIGAERTLSITDQRHRAVFNGIWEVGAGFQLSGIYFFGSGNRDRTYYNKDLRDLGVSGSYGSRRLRGPNSPSGAEGTIIPRNPFVGDQIHRFDMRLQRRFALGGRASLDGMLEFFNVFNHANYGTYQVNELSKSYLDARASTNRAHQPRTIQLGFRVAF